MALVEKRLDFGLQEENPADRRADFLKLNPAGDVPVLVEVDGQVISNSSAIVEYLEEIHPLPAFFPGNAAERAEIRRLVAWFDIKFNHEVSEKLVGQKLINRLLRKGPPDSTAIHAGYENCRTHMDYIEWLVERRYWLAGDDLTMADIAAGAHISCLDYIGDVPWDRHPRARDWYARLKSRPSFRAILEDQIPGEPPPEYYADPDF